MNAERGAMVDHENRDTLDNQRLNLRICTNRQNQANARVRSDNTSGYKGVCWNKGTGKWKAQMTNGNGKRLCIDYFPTAIEAARAYDAEALRLHGEFALTNEKLGLFR